MRKRILAVLIAVAVVCLLSTAAFAADSGVDIAGTNLETDTYYKFAADGTMSSGSAADYNAYHHGGVLYLNNLTLTNYTAECIFADSALTLELIGASSVSSNDFNAVEVTGNLTVQGTGSLSATANCILDVGPPVIGVSVGGDLAVISGSLSGTGGANTHGSYGVKATNNISVSGTASLSGVGGNATGANNAESFGVHAGSLTLTGGSLNGTSGEAASTSCGVYSDGATNVTGGELKGIGKESTQGNSFGVGSYGALVVSGGLLEGTAGSTVGSSSDASTSSGVYTFNTITVSGSGTLKGTGGNLTDGNGKSFGVYSAGTTEVSGGSLIGIGGTINRANTNLGNESCGVQSVGALTVFGTGTLNGTGRSVTIRSIYTPARATVFIPALR